MAGTFGDFLDVAFSDLRERLLTEHDRLAASLGEEKRLAEDRLEERAAAERRAAEQLAADERSRAAMASLEQAEKLTAALSHVRAVCQSVEAQKGYLRESCQNQVGPELGQDSCHKSKDRALAGAQSFVRDMFQGSDVTLVSPRPRISKDIKAVPVEVFNGVPSPSRSTARRCRHTADTASGDADVEQNSRRSRVRSPRGNAAPLRFIPHAAPSDTLSTLSQLALETQCDGVESACVASQVVVQGHPAQTRAVSHSHVIRRASVLAVASSADELVTSDERSDAVKPDATHASKPDEKGAESISVAVRKQELLNRCSLPTSTVAKPRSVTRGKSVPPSTTLHGVEPTPPRRLEDLLRSDENKRRIGVRADLAS